MTATSDTPQHKSFTRVVDHKYFMSLVKEASRVKYIVQQEGQHMYNVQDDETGEKVFFGMKHSSGKWIASFSTAYWVEPALTA